ncbi:uncharacterized protein [Anabrus simplex]|uniref:uncharacterized protein isoform X2 n=1 Tax=Anabrus simplex TaxID=316456 RepID=UPI0035A2A6F6
MPSCFVSGCRSGYTSVDRGKHFFRVPREEGDFSKWEKAIPKRNIPFSHTSAICENHFSEENFIKVDSFVIDGKDVHIPRIRWSLKPGAVPHIFENLFSTIRKPLHIHSKEIRKQLVSSEAVKSLQKLPRVSHHKRRRRSSRKMEDPHFIKCDPGWLPDTDSSCDYISNLMFSSGDQYRLY